tara:strand:+ start:4040 stop:7411 length:3372 start_codon:yes stop_codon:yes gene_type:complete
LEQYLLDCISDLQRAGDDIGRRKRAINKSDTWDLLNKNWKALAVLAAEKTAPKVIEKDDIGNKENSINRSHRNRIGRRGGRQSRMSLEDHLPSPQQAINSEYSAAFKLSVLIAQKYKMTTWDKSYEEEMNTLRLECSQGIHPVWSRLAREAPIFAEFERFDIIEEETKIFNSKDWIKEANLDPNDITSLRNWLNMEIPFSLTSTQALSLEKIRKDLAGRPRPLLWPQIMKGKLRGLENEGALLESILLLSANSGEAIEVLEKIKDVKGLKTVVAKQIKLFLLNNNDHDGIIDCINQKGEDKLANAIRINAWKKIELIDEELSLELLLSGKKILENANETLPTILLWRISKKLFEKEEYNESIKMIEKLSINNEDQLIFSIKAISKSYSEKFEQTILQSLNNSEEESIAFAMRSIDAPSKIQLEASKILAKTDSIRYTDEILSVMTRTADIENLAEKMNVDSSLGLVYPFRALMVWHLMPADVGVKKIDQLIDLRRQALISLETSEKDDVLSDVSISLISLLGGVPSDINSIHKILDKSAIIVLNQVRKALSSDGSGVVKNSLIASLDESIGQIELSTLDRRLFEALIDSLYVNSSAMQLQSGNTEKEENALLTLERLAAKEDNTIRTIRAITNLVKEHNVGIESLEKWYRIHDKDSAEYQIIRAALQKKNGNRLNAARAYKEGALKIEENYEESSLILRKAMIEYAHSETWKEAVELLDQNPELETLLTQRFQLYLRTCADNNSGKTDIATKRLIRFVSEQEKINKADLEGDYNKRRKEALELIQRYPDEHNLPDRNFKGRVKAALMTLEKSGGSRESDLERRFQLELHDMKDIFELTLLGEQIAEQNPLRGIRRFEEAIETGYFKGRQIERLRDTQRAVFVSQSSNIPIKDRRTIKNLGLKSLILVDTNVLIHALKDDLLQEISNDDFGSFDWSVERSFHMMLRRQGGKETFLSIPPAALSEFTNRTKNPDAVVKLFNDVYINREQWNKKITPEFLKKKVKQICKSFSTWPQEDYSKKLSKIELEEFLLKHENIFQLVDDQKRNRSEEIPKRTELNGKEIYPEGGDMEIMRDAASLASLPLQEIGNILVATRDSDFRLVSRALEEEYGFGVVSDAQQLNSRI